MTRDGDRLPRTAVVDRGLLVPIGLGVRNHNAIPLDQTTPHRRFQRLSRPNSWLPMFAAS